MVGGGTAAATGEPAVDGTAVDPYWPVLAAPGRPQPGRYANRAKGSASDRCVWDDRCPRSANLCHHGQERSHWYGGPSPEADHSAPSPSQPTGSTDQPRSPPGWDYHHT